MNRLIHWLCYRRSYPIADIKVSGGNVQLPVVLPAETQVTLTYTYDGTTVTTPNVKAYAVEPRWWFRWWRSKRTSP